MKHKNSSLLPLPFILIFILMGMSCQGPSKSEKHAKSWSESMQGLAGDVYGLIPYVYDQKAFSHPKNAKIIETRLEKLSEDGHEISAEMGKPFLGKDPLLRFSLSGLKEDLQRASQSFKAGNTEYSRKVLKTSIGHCFRCHSVVNVGSQAPWTLDGIEKLQLAPVEKVDLLVAGRKYKEAMDFADSKIRNLEFMQAEPYEYEDLLRKYLALALRWEQKTKGPVETLAWVEQQNALPTYLESQIQSWVRSLKDLKASDKDLSVYSAKQLISKAKKSMSRAREAKEYAKDHAGDVEYLMASAYLHEALRKDLVPTQRGEVLYSLGQIYEVLDDLGAWNLHEVYYEQCVSEFPQSRRAQACYRRLEASVYFGYSGSSGVHIPAFERARLKKLKDMAF